MTELEVSDQRSGSSDRPSYFSCLSEDCLLHVLLYMSDRPRHANWLAKLKPSCVLSILRLGGPLATVLQKEICVSGLATCSPLRQQNSDNSLSFDKCLKAPAVQFDEFVSGIGPGLQELSILSSLRVYNTTKLYENCVYLKSLKLRESYIYLAAILEACSGKLQSLDCEGGVMGVQDVSAVANHCDGLQSLRIACEISNVKGLTRVWETIGSSLEFLSFRPPVILRTTWAVEIPWFCSKVTTIQLVGKKAYRSFAVQMFRQFGKQLRRIILMTPGTCLPPQYLRQVLEACPDAVVDAHVISDISETLKLLEDRLRTLVLSGQGFYSPIDRNIALSNLEELGVNAQLGFGQILDNFFWVPKLTVRVLKIGGVLSHLSDLDKITGQVATIEDFSCMVSTNSNGTFEKFALNNPSLRRVYVRLTGYSIARLIFQTRATIAHFAHCPALKQLDVDFQLPKLHPEEVTEMCAPFRGRDADIFVNGTQYMQ